MKSVLRALVLGCLAASEAALGAPGASDLSTLPIEELLNIEVYSASKFQQKSSQAPAAVTVITAADIESYGWRTLGDLLRSVPGMYVTYDRSYQYVGVRGFNRPGDYNSRILLLVDGYRVNDANYDTASVSGELFLDLSLIDRVEVVRGPGSSIYGSNAFFGVVNVITRRGRDLDGWHLSGEAGSFNSRKAEAIYGQSDDKGADLLLAASHSKSDGQDLYFPEFDTPANHGGVAHGLDSEETRRLFGKLSYGGFNLMAAYSDRTKGLPTAPYDSAFDVPGAHATDSQAVLDIGYQSRLDERLDLATRLYYGGYFYHQELPYLLPAPTTNKDIGNSEWWGAEAKLTGHYDRHTLVVGTEHQDNYRQDQKNFDLSAPAVYLDARHSSRRSAVYFQDEVVLREALRLNAGLRYDDYSTAGGTLNPRAALIYDPRPDTTLKLIYGTAFRAPNAFELYYQDLISKANPNLNPEKITTYEVSVEHRLRPDFRVSASLYENTIHDLINQTTDPSDGLLVFQNVGRVDARGVELEAERAWGADTRLRASYAWQTSRDQVTGQELVNSPHHLAKLNLVLPMGAGVRAGGELQYTGGRQTLAGHQVDGYLLANLTLSSDTLLHGARVSASLYNLFNQPYADPGRPEHTEDAIAQDGRSFRVKVTFKF